VVETNEKFIIICVLGQVNETGVTMFENVIDQFLDYSEYDEFSLGLKPLPVVMKAGSGIHAARTADLLKKVIDRGFKPEILKGGRHEAMRDVADQLDGIVDDLLCIVDALELGGLIQVDKVFIEVKPCGGKQGTRIIMQIGCYSLSFFFLQLNRSIQEHFLLVIFHFLKLHLESNDFTLMENYENDQPNR
jgi:hypothetical protein